MKFIVDHSDLQFIQQKGFLSTEAAKNVWEQISIRCRSVHEDSNYSASSNEKYELAVPSVRGDVKPKFDFDFCIAYSKKNGSKLASSIADEISKEHKKSARLAVGQQESLDAGQVEERVANSSSLIVLLTEQCLKEIEVIFPMLVAKKYFKNPSLVILVHDASTCLFPGYNEQPADLTELFSEKAVTYLPCYSKLGIQEIIAKYESEKNVLKNLLNNQPDSHDHQEDLTTRVFLSHKRSTGQGIAGRLYEGLKGDYAVFIDSEAKFKIHNLQKIVEHTTWFVFILTPGILLSLWCLEELKSAIKHNKKIVVVRELSYKLPKELPAEWQEVASVLRSPDELIWMAEYNSACIEAIKSRIGFPDKVYFPLLKALKADSFSPPNNQDLETDYDLAKIMQIPPVAPDNYNSLWDYSFQSNSRPSGIDFQLKPDGPQVSYQDGFARLAALPLRGTNVWSVVTVSRKISQNAIFVYSFRLNEATGGESKIQFGKHIWRQFDDGRSAEWVHWTNQGFVTQASTGIRPRDGKWHTVAVVIGSNNQSVFEDGIFKYTRNFDANEKEWEANLSVCHLTRGSSLSLDIGCIRVLPSHK